MGKVGEIVGKKRKHYNSCRKMYEGKHYVAGRNGERKQNGMEG